MDRLALGLTNALIGALAQIDSFGLVSRSTMMRLRNHTSGFLVHDVGRELSVDLLVAGTIDRDGPRVRVCAELLEVTSDRLLWTAHYDREVGNLLDLESDVARAVARDIRLVLPLETV
jgi:TolB-like protein